MKACRNCGRDITIEANFCPSCGISMLGVVADERFLGGSGGRGEAAGRPEVQSPGPGQAGQFGRISPEELAAYILPVRGKLISAHQNQPPMLHAIAMGDWALAAAIPQITCEAVGGKAQEAMDLAYAYSLGLIAGRVYDDIMDRTIERKGKRTVWREFGDPVAVPLGIECLYEMLDGLTNYDARLGRATSDELSKTFRLALVESARAEEREKLSMRSNVDLPFSERLRLAQGKRGILIAAGTAGGAIVGRGTEEEVELLRNYGMHMGTANQLFDDSSDPDYTQVYREQALSVSRELTAEALKCTDRLRVTEAQRMLRELCKISEEPLL